MITGKKNVNLSVKLFPKNIEEFQIDSFSEENFMILNVFTKKKKQFLLWAT